MRTKGVKVVSITSGKGGVGKTLTTVNMAIAAQQMGQRVLILDGDMGLANVDVVLGLQPRYNINDVLEGHAKLDEIIIEGPLGIRIIPSGSGIAKLANLTHVQRIQLLDEISTLKESYDLLLIDTGAGISENVLHLNSVADCCVVVTTPEPHALTDAYAMIKVLSETYDQKQVKLAVNQVCSAKEGLALYERFAEVAGRFLNVAVEYLGHIPSDPEVQRSIIRRQAASANSTFTIAGQAWNNLTRDLLYETKNIDKRSNQEIWRELLWMSQGSQSVNF